MSEPRDVDRLPTEAEAHAALEQLREIIVLCSRGALSFEPGERHEAASDFYAASLLVLVAGAFLQRATGIKRTSAFPVRIQFYTTQSIVEDGVLKALGGVMRIGKRDIQSGGHQPFEKA